MPTRRDRQFVRLLLLCSCLAGSSFSAEATPVFEPHRIHSVLTHEIDSINAISSEALLRGRLTWEPVEAIRLQDLLADTNLQNYFTKTFDLSGAYAELKAGGLVQDWESIALGLSLKVGGAPVTGTELAAVYATWRENSLTQTELLASGEVEKIEVFFAENLQAENPNAGATVAVTNSGQKLSTQEDWVSWASKQGLPAGGASLMALWGIYVRRKQLEKTATKLKVGQHYGSSSSTLQQYWQRFVGVSVERGEIAKFQSQFLAYSRVIKRKNYQQAVAKLVVPRKPVISPVLAQYQAALKQLEAQSPKPKDHFYSSQFSKYQLSISSEMVYAHRAAEFEAQAKALTPKMRFGGYWSRMRARDQYYKLLREIRLNKDRLDRHRRTRLQQEQTLKKYADFKRDTNQYLEQRYWQMRRGWRSYSKSRYFRGIVESLKSSVPAPIRNLALERKVAQLKQQSITAQRQYVQAEQSYKSQLARYNAQKKQLFRVYYTVPLKQETNQAKEFLQDQAWAWLLKSYRDSPNQSWSVLWRNFYQRFGSSVLSAHAIRTWWNQQLQEAPLLQRLATEIKTSRQNHEAQMSLESNQLFENIQKYLTGSEIAQMQSGSFNQAKNSDLEVSLSGMTAQINAQIAGLKQAAEQEYQRQLRNMHYYNAKLSQRLWQSARAMHPYSRYYPHMKYDFQRRYVDGLRRAYVHENLYRKKRTLPDKDKIYNNFLVVKRRALEAELKSFKAAKTRYDFRRQFSFDNTQTSKAALRVQSFLKVLPKLAAKNLNFKHLQRSLLESDQIKTTLKELKEKLTVSPYQVQIQQFKAQLRTSNQKTFEQWLQNDAKGWEDYLRGNRNYGGLRQSWANEKRNFTKSGSQAESDFSRQIQSINATYEGYSAGRAQQLVSMAEVAARSRVGSYKGWERLYHMHPLVHEARNKTLQVKIDQLQKLEQARRDLLQKQINELGLLQDTPVRLLQSSLAWYLADPKDRSTMSIDADLSASNRVTNHNVFTNLEAQRKYFNAQVTRYAKDIMASPIVNNVATTTQVIRGRYLNIAAQTIQNMMYYASPTGQITSSQRNDAEARALRTQLGLANGNLAGRDVSYQGKLVAMSHSIEQMARTQQGSKRTLASGGGMTPLVHFSANQQKAQATYTGMLRAQEVDVVKVLASTSSAGFTDEYEVFSKDALDQFGANSWDDLSNFEGQILTVWIYKRLLEKGVITEELLEDAKQKLVDLYEKTDVHWKNLAWEKLEKMGLDAFLVGAGYTRNTNIERSIGDIVKQYPTSFYIEGYGQFDKFEHWDQATEQMKKIRNNVHDFSNRIGVRPEIAALILHGENSNAFYNGDEIWTKKQNAETWRDMLVNKSYGISNLRDSSREFIESRLSDTERDFYETLGSDLHAKDLFLTVKNIQINQLENDLKMETVNEISQLAVYHNTGTFTDPFKTNKSDWNADPRNSHIINEFGVEKAYYTVRSKVERFNKVLHWHLDADQPLKFMNYPTK